VKIRTHDPRKPHADALTRLRYAPTGGGAIIVEGPPAAQTAPMAKGRKCGNARQAEAGEQAPEQHLDRGAVVARL